MVSKDHKLSVRRQCKLLTLSRSHLYYEPKGESAENLRFMEIIDKQFLETPWYGSRQMARFMKRNNHKCGRHRVRRLMRLMRLVPIYQEPNTSKKHPQHKIWPYLLRNVVIDRPNQVWCADITYIPMRRGFLYLVAIMDWHSRKVLAWRLSNSMDAARSRCPKQLRRAMRAVTFAMSLKTFRGDPSFALQNPRPEVRLFCLAAIAAVQSRPLAKAAIFSSGIDDYARVALLRAFEKEPRLLSAVDHIAQRRARSIGRMAAESRN